MSNELQIIEKAALSHNNLPVQLVNNAETGIQIANNGVINVNVVSTSGNAPVYDASIQICTDCYNLFVVDEALGNNGSFMVAKDRALTIKEGTDPEISSKLAILDDEAIGKVKSYPSLFASVNRHGRNTDSDHIAYYGRVTDVTVQKNGTGIKISYQAFCAIPQQSINELSLNLSIKSASAVNELCRPHWTVKRVNIIEALKAEGMNLPLL